MKAIKKICFAYGKIVVSRPHVTDCAPLIIIIMISIFGPGEMKYLVYPRIFQRSTSTCVLYTGQRNSFTQESFAYNLGFPRTNIYILRILFIYTYLIQFARL